MPKEDCRDLNSPNVYVKRYSSYILKSPLGLTLLARNFSRRHRVAAPVMHCRS